MPKEKDNDRGLIDEALIGEIDAGIESAAQAATDEPQDQGQDQGQSQGSQGQDHEQDQNQGDQDQGQGEDKLVVKPDAIGDSLLERAIKAGMSMAEARQYPNAGLLTIALGRMESSAKKAEGSADSQNGVKKETAVAEEDLLGGVPDLDPDEYDEKIVAGFKAMKDIIRKQHETIKEMRGGQSADWFASQVAGLGAGVAETLTPEKRDALKTKFDVLTAGYKAAGHDVDRGNVFREAASLTISEEIASASSTEKNAKLERRAGQHIARPSGHRQQPKGDAFDDVAGELDRKFFDKK